MVFDGKTLSFLGKGQNAYIQAEAPGTIDTLIDQLRDKFHRQLPGADLLQSNVYDALMTDVTDVKDLGSGVIGGKECDHLAFRAKDTDWQIWIAQGKDPYPCRYVITSKGVDQAPQFTMEIRDWKAGAGVAGADFTFKPPAGAKQLDAKDLKALKETSDLPENYRTGEARMTMSRTLKIVLLAGLVSLVDPEAVIESAGTDGVQRCSLCRSEGGASADAGQRGGRRPPDDTALRGRRV